MYKLKNRIGFAFAFSFFCAKILREISILYPKDKKWNIFKVLHKKNRTIEKGERSHEQISGNVSHKAENTRRGGNVCEIRRHLCLSDRTGGAGADL